MASKWIFAIALFVLIIVYFCYDKVEIHNVIEGKDDEAPVHLEAYPDHPNQFRIIEENYAEIETTQVQKESAWYTWKIEQNKRQKVIDEACRGVPREYQLQKLLKKGYRSFFNLLVDDKHKAIYCYIPKVGCTNWKKLWMRLTGRTNLTDVSLIPQKKPHTLGNKMALFHGKDKISDIAWKLQNYTKMITVRHPFERLLSAYRDKIQPGKGNEAFQKYVWKKHKATGIQWVDFVEYLISGGSNSNDHWNTYENLCHPCAIRYDVIVHFQTLLTESEKFLRLIGAPEDLHFPVHSNSKAQLTSSEMLHDHMKELSRDQVMGLYKVYQRDFQLFQYD